MLQQKSQSEYFASLLKTLVVEAGTMARHMRMDAKAEQKFDNSIVTEADLAVSDLINNRLSNLMAKNEHILIDEETVDTLPSMEDVLNTNYQWVLDPIDGTAPFFTGLPFYAVSLGLMKKGEPYLGAAYLPELDELYWTDGKGNVMRQRGAKGASTPRAVLKEKISTYEHTPIVNGVSNHQYAFSGYLVDTGATVVNGVMTCHSDVAGIIDQAKIWDNAAIMAMFKTLGMKMVHADTKTEFTKFSTNNLNADWSLKAPYIAALPENLEFIYTKFKDLNAEQAA